MQQQLAYRTISIRQKNKIANQDNQIKLKTYKLD